MTRVDEKIETCPCQVCRSDLAYIIPCLTTVPAGIVEAVWDTGTTARVEDRFPIPLMM